MNEQKETFPKKLFQKESVTEIREMSIFYDEAKKQYTVRIPNQFADTAKLDTKKHKIRFTLIIPPANAKDNTVKLTGELIYG